MANRINPWPAGAQAVNDLTVTTIENVSKAAAASTSLLLRVAGTGTVASALAVRAFLDAIPMPQPVRRDAGQAAPAEPAAPANRAPAAEPQERDGVEAPKVIEPHDSEQVAHATAEVAAAAVAAAERAEEQAAEQGELLAEQAEQIAEELEQAAEDTTAEDESAEVDTPPIENWDQLTLASARARMRRLSLEDLHRLLAYERSHAERDSVVTMLENRIAKVEAGGA